MFDFLLYYLIAFIVIIILTMVLIFLENKAPCGSKQKIIYKLLILALFGIELLLIIKII